MSVMKLLKLSAHAMCGATYVAFSMGVHFDVLYLVPGIAYGILVAADFNH